MRPMLHLYSKDGWGAHRTGLPKVSCCDKLAASRGAGCNNSAISPLRGPQKYSVKDASLWQDPLMEVRKAFGAKVRRTVLLLNARPSYCAARFQICRHAAHGGHGPQRDKQVAF